MALTQIKYDKDKKKLKYVTTATNDEVLTKLGELEEILAKYNLDSDSANYLNLDRSLLLGKSALNRIRLARGHRIYFLSGRKIRRARLVGFADNGLSLDQLEIEKKEERATIPYTRVYISRREARRAKKAVQVYRLSQAQYQKIFKNETLSKKTYLVETVRGTDEFMIYTKVFHAYYRTRLPQAFTISQLKEKYGFDIEEEFPKERKEFKKKNLKYLEYAVYLQQH